MRAPALVTVSRRVVRSSRSSPTRDSRVATRVLTTDFERPNNRAALVNEPVSTTRTKHSSD